MTTSKTRARSGGHQGSIPRLGKLAGRIARWSAMRPREVSVISFVALLLSLLSLSQLHITSSLAVMLGRDSNSAAAMERITNDYRSGDALLLLAELPAGVISDESGQTELIGFATRLEVALKSDPVASSMIAWVRFREDSAYLTFAREVMLPNGVFYLSDEKMEELTRRLEPRWMEQQFARNETMIGAPGPAGVALSGNVLRDPLRLLELIPPEFRPGSDAVGVSSATDPTMMASPDLSEDNRAILIHIGSASVAGDYEAAGKLVDEVVRVSASVNSAQLRVEPAGHAAIARESSRVIRHDSVVSSLVSIGLLYLLFLIFYRRWSAGLVIGGVAGVGMIAGIGVVALSMNEVSPLAAMIAALLAGLGTDYGIHFHSHYDGYREQGLGSVDASVCTAEQMAVPIVTNCFTSIFGFLSLWPSKIQMLSDFAMMGAAGLIGALLAVFVLMPAVLALIERKSVAKPAERAVYGKLADVVSARPRAWMASSVAVLGVVVVAAGIQGFSLQFESDLTVMHPHPSRALNATNEVIKRFAKHGDLIPIEVRASTPEQLVQATHELANALDSRACRDVGVTGMIGLNRLLPDPRNTDRRRLLLDGLDTERVLRSFDEAVDKSPFAPAAYREYREFLHTLVSSHQAPTLHDVLEHRGVAEQVFPIMSNTDGKRPTNTVVLATLVAPLHDGVQRKATIETLNLASATVQSGEVTVAGIAAVAVELEQGVREGLPQSIAISFVLVLLWLALVFRRAIDVVLALIPLVFAGGTTVVFIMATGQRFNPINCVAIPLLDGIAVDAGVFLVSVYRAHGFTHHELRRHLRSTTHAVLLSVSTTVTAFAALSLAHTPAVRSLGFVSAVGIAASGIGALFLLMPILIRRVSQPMRS